MKFGKEDTFSLIEKILQQSEESAYDPLCIILYEDIGILMKKYCRNVRGSDREDMIQDVITKVIIHLPSFYITSMQKTESERNAWLRTIVINVRNDYFRELSRSVEKDAVMLVETIGHNGGKTIEEEFVLRDEILEMIAVAFRIQTTPEKLMAFVYNSLLGRLSRTNGSPKDVTAVFCRYTLDEMYKKMLRDLSDTLQCEIPNHVLKPLKDKVDLRPNDIFDLTPRSITDSSNWITKKIKEQMRNG